MCDLDGEESEVLLLMNRFSEGMFCDQINDISNNNDL